jgi:hypothetical protein
MPEIKKNKQFFQLRLQIFLAVLVKTMPPEAASLDYGNMLSKYRGY